MIRRLSTKLFLAAAVILSGVSSATAGVWPFDVNSPYKPYCRNGNCGGGDYYVGGWLKGCRNPCNHPYGIKGQGNQSLSMPQPYNPSPAVYLPPAPASAPTPR